MPRQGKKLVVRTQASTPPDSHKEDQYFQRPKNKLRKLRVNTLSRNKGLSESKSCVKLKCGKSCHQVPIDPLYSLHTKASIHQDVAIRLNKQDSVHTDRLLDSGSETNLVSQKLVKQLNLPTPAMASISQKLLTVDGHRMQTYGVHQLTFEITDRLRHTRFFKDTFLACDCDNPIILGMPWLTLANPNVDWQADKSEHLEWKKYDASVALETTRRITLTNAKSFAEDALDKACGVYVMHVKHLPDLHPSPSNAAPQAMSAMDLKQQAFDVTEVTISDVYKEFSDVFSDDKANIFPDHGLDDHAIDLIDDRQPPYGPVYNLSEVKLTVLRQYIDKHLANQFICPSKSPAGAPILFVKNLQGVYAYVLTIEVSTILQSKTDTHFLLLASH